jgi:hypothetical protein
VEFGILLRVSFGLSSREPREDKPRRMVAREEKLASAVISDRRENLPSPKMIT